jgi:photosystem II stability/assembly factor-like uncharacterized protein
MDAVSHLDEGLVMSRARARSSLVLSAALAVLLGGWTLDRSASAGNDAATPSSRSRFAIDSTILKSLRWRSIGPDRGGRSITISGVKGQPKVGYVGATGGGLWKTTDGGEHWAPVTDYQIHSSSVGAVAVSESNPDIVFIGMGESCIRGNIMAGDGVYKSTDAGKTWTHVGFGDKQTISKIRIHPANPDIVFVAAFGNYSVPSEERGVYKSTDGGKNWRRVLFRDNKTAAIDISIDPHNPDVMYAAMWEAFRTEYTMSSGGPGSGLFKSTDGGETWKEITRNPGLPAGMIGKIGISISGADPNRVFAIIENENGGLFRTDDGGANWTLVNSGRNLRQRAFYYTHVTADPNNKDRVYVQNVGTFSSSDGGKTMVNWGGSDSHDMWIDPNDSQHVLYANDGGGTITYAALNPQHTFSSRDYPTGQFYRVATTKHVPYHVCGAQQDASTVCVSSGVGAASGGRGGGGRGAAAPAPYGAGGSEDGYIAPDPKDIDVFFAGGNNGSFLTRLNRRTGEVREVGPYPRMFSGEPSSALKERWQWTYPIIFSPVDPNVLYTSSQHVWKTLNGGQSWERISPDLTRHDPKTLGHSGGPITGDMNGPEVYAVVFALGPSRRDVNVLWAGSDDGLIHVTKDGGKSWANVTPKDMPDFGRVSIIDASAFDAGTAYAAVKRPLLDDDAPYIFRTHDFGKTWTRIVNGIGASDYVHSVREDPTRRGLLYATAQHGVYFSLDDGDNWQSLSLNLPDLPVSDLAVEATSLAIATHGRGFYVLENIEPLRQYTTAITAPDMYLFKPAPAIRSAGGARIEYWLKHPAQTLKVDVLDSAGRLVRSFDGAASAAGRGGRGGRGAAGVDTAAAPDDNAGRGGRGGAPQTTSMAQGLNSMTWDLQYPGATTFPGMILWGASTNGPLAVPGRYQVRLTVDGRAQIQPFVVRKHPLYTDVTQADLEAQFALAIKLRDKVTEANNAVIEIRDLRKQTADRLAKSQDPRLKAAGDTLVKNLTAVEEEIYQVRNQSGQDPLNFPIKLNNRLASLLGVVSRGDGRPIGNAAPIFNDLSGELKVQTERLRQVLARDLTALNAELKRLGMEAVTVEKKPIA